jgi:hypothetical protein
MGQAGEPAAKALAKAFRGGGVAHEPRESATSLDVEITDCGAAIS